MRYFGTLTFALLSFIFTQNLNVQSAPQHIIKWKIAHYPVEYFVRVASDFKEYVEKESNGSIRVDISTENASSYDDVKHIRKHVLEEVNDGAIQMSQVYTSYVASAYNPEFGVFELPYLFQNDKHVTKIVEGKLGQELLASISKNAPVVGLGYTYSGGFIQITSKGKQIAKYEDFKGLKLQDRSGGLVGDMYDKLGVLNILAKNGKRFMTQAEYYENGLIDISDSTFADLKEIFSVSESKRPDTVLETNHHVLITTVLMNKDFLSSLPKNLQEVVKQGAFLSARKERQRVVDDGKKIKSLLSERGVQVSKLSSQETERMKNFLMPVYDNYYANNSRGKEIVEEIKALK